jgi:hypothetical protein
MAKMHQIEYDEVVRETDKAWLLLMTWVDDDFTMWVPKEPCYLDTKRKYIVMPHWLVERKAEELEIQELIDIIQE